jgi:hypothetical protein
LCPESIIALGPTMSQLRAGSLACPQFDGNVLNFKPTLTPEAMPPSVADETAYTDTNAKANSRGDGGGINRGGSVVTTIIRLVVVRIVIVVAVVGIPPSGVTKSEAIPAVVSITSTISIAAAIPAVAATVSTVAAPVSTVAAPVSTVASAAPVAAASVTAAVTAPTKAATCASAAATHRVTTSATRMTPAPTTTLCRKAQSAKHNE